MTMKTLPHNLVRWVLCALLLSFAPVGRVVAQTTPPAPAPPKKIETAGQLLTRRVRQIDLYVTPQHLAYLIKNWHADKEMVAWATLNWKDVGEELPLMPFYDGNATYTVFLNSGQTTDSGLLYQWQAQLEPVPVDGGDGLFLDPAAEPDFIYKLPPSFYKKILHFDLGSDPKDLTQTSTVRVSVLPTDPNNPNAPDLGGAIWGTAKAVIHWHWAYEDAAGDTNLPAMTLAAGSLVTMAPVRDESLTLHQPDPKPVEQVQINDRVMWPGHPRPRTVIDKIVHPDGSITLLLGLAAEDNPDDPAFDLTERGYHIHDAYLDVQHTGAHHVKAGLELYKGVAEFYATGPLYELSAVALSAAGGKGLELLRFAIEEERVAQEAGAMASEARVYALEARQAAQEEHNVEEAAALTQRAEQAEKEASQMEAGAQETRELAAHNRNMGQAAQSDVQEAQGIQQASVGNSAGLPLTTEASVEKKLETYLLNPNHPVGMHKARWFRGALGFTQANQEQLAAQVVFNEAQATVTGVTQYGTKYNQIIPITGANGKVINVTFAWIRNNDGIVRLVTSTLGA